MTESSGQQDTNDMLAAAYVCSPEDGHHWVSQLSEERIWVQTCSLCSRQSVDLEEHDAKIRADERERVARDEVQIYARAWDEISDEVFEKVNDYDRMKAKVEALAESYPLFVDGEPTLVGAFAADVLALFPKEKP